MILYPKCDCVIEGFRRTSVTAHVLLTHSIFFLNFFLFDSLEYTNLSCLKRGLIQNKKWFYFCPMFMCDFCRSAGVEWNGFVGFKLIQNNKHTSSLLLKIPVHHGTASKAIYRTN